MISRRNLLGIFAVFSLNACSGSSQPVTTITATVLQDLGLIASGLAGALPGLKVSGSLNGGAYNTISNAVGNIQSIVASVNSSTSLSSGQTSVQQIETLLNTIVRTAAGLPLPPPFGPALVAASILLPIVEIGVNLAVTQLKIPQAAAMSPDQARQILVNAAASR